MLYWSQLMFAKSQIHSSKSMYTYPFQAYYDVTTIGLPYSSKTVDFGSFTLLKQQHKLKSGKEWQTTTGSANWKCWMHSRISILRGRETLQETWCEEVLLNRATGQREQNDHCGMVGVGQEILTNQPKRSSHANRYQISQSRAILWIPNQRNYPHTSNFVRTSCYLYTVISNRSELVV